MVSELRSRLEAAERALALERSDIVEPLRRRLDAAELALSMVSVKRGGVGGHNDVVEPLRRRLDAAELALLMVSVKRGEGGSCIRPGPHPPWGHPGADLAQSRAGVRGPAA